MADSCPEDIEFNIAVFSSRYLSGIGTFPGMGLSSVDRSVGIKAELILKKLDGRLAEVPVWCFFVFQGSVAATESWLNCSIITGMFVPILAFSLDTLHLEQCDTTICYFIFYILEITRDATNAAKAGSRLDVVASALLVLWMGKEGQMGQSRKWMRRREALWNSTQFCFLIESRGRGQVNGQKWLSLSLRLGCPCLGWTWTELTTDAMPCPLKRIEPVALSSSW